jgi:hypothetical protein
MLPAAPEMAAGTAKFEESGHVVRVDQLHTFYLNDARWEEMSPDRSKLCPRVV